VRHGADRAEVTATFTIANNPAARAWLAEQSIEHEDESVILRRIVGTDGRSRAYVNSQAMPVQALRQLGETLVDIHGQMEYQSLMKRAAQRELLDQSGDYRELLDSVAAQHRAWSELREQRDRAAASAQDREARPRAPALSPRRAQGPRPQSGRARRADSRTTATRAARPIGIGRARDPAVAARSRRYECGTRGVARVDRLALADGARCALRIHRQGDRRELDRAARRY
jgi:hypothetical protein